MDKPDEKVYANIGLEGDFTSFETSRLVGASSSMRSQVRAKN